MPSGAKRRKAAKKKKGKDAQNSSGAKAQGNGDLKNQDERDSDGAEASSPTSQEQHPLIDIEEEEKGDAQSLDDENKFAEQTPDDVNGSQVAEGDGVVEIVREIESEEVSERSQNVSAEYVESTEVSGDGGSFRDSARSSSSSSSDDESQLTKKSSEVEESGKLKEETCSSITETAPIEDPVTPNCAVSEGVPCDTKGAPVDEAHNSVGEVASVVDSVKLEAPASEVVNWVLETIPVGNYVKPYVPLFEKVTSDAKGVLEEAYKSIAAETASVVDLVKAEVSVSGEKICVTDSAPVGNSVAADVVESGLKDNEEKKLPSSAESPDVSLVLVDSSSKKTKDKVVPLPDEDAKTSSTVAGSEVLETEDELLPSSDAPNFEHGAEHVQSSEVFPECSEKQPLVPSAPRAVQKTSWMDCCGLFSVLTGSN